MTSAPASPAHIARLDPEELELAGRTSGLLYALGGLTLALLPVLGPITVSAASVTRAPPKTPPS